MTQQQDDSLYNATKQALSDAGVPEAIAEAAAEVIRRDDASQQNLGRTEEDQNAVTAAWRYLIEGEEQK